MPTTQERVARLVRDVANFWPKRIAGEYVVEGEERKLDILDLVIEEARKLGRPVVLVPNDAEHPNSVRFLLSIPPEALVPIWIPFGNKMLRM